MNVKKNRRISRRAIFIFAGLTAVVLSLSALANDAATENQLCDDQTVGDLRLSCLTKVLSDADDRLNEAYRHQLQDKTKSERMAMRNTQRRWIAFRNAACQFNEKKGVSDRAAWLNAAVIDPDRANCLIQLTTSRTSELESQSAVGAGRAPLLFAEVKPTLPDSAYAARSQKAHRAGRFYFEVVIDHGNIKQSIEADIQLQVHGNRKFVATTYSIRPQDQVIRIGDTGSITITGGNLDIFRLPKVVVGVAVDLEARQFFHHRDGDWRGKPPSSGNGLNIPSGEDFYAEVTSSVSLLPLVKGGVLDVNFGGHPFVYPPPAGYAAFDDEAQSTGVIATPTTFTVAKPGMPIAGQPLSVWIQRYWQWARSFPPGETPYDDSTGARCSAGQTQPVFFLTGSSKATPISRECSVPRGQYVLIPLINVLAQDDTSSQAQCDDLLRPVRQVNESVIDLSILINGQPVQSPNSYKGESGCFELRDISRGVSGRAAGAGYWVVLKPLDVGNYELYFSGRYRADGFSQDVKYKLRVE